MNLGAREAYCLYCFAPIPPIVLASSQCGVCHRTTRKVDQATYWSRNEHHLWIERHLKTFGALMAAAGLLVVLVNAPELSRQYFWGAPFCGVFILGLLALWWDLAGMVTRHASMLHLDVLLPPIVASLGFIGVTMARAVMRARIPTERDYWGNKVTPDVDWPPNWYALPFLVLGVVVWFLLRWLKVWRAEVMERSLERGRARMAKTLPGFAARQDPTAVER